MNNSKENGKSRGWLTKDASGKNKTILLIVLVILSCVIMGVVDAVVKPGYLVKSVIKILLFLLIPVIYSRLDKSCDLKRLFIPRKNGITIALACGAGVYIVILGAYMLFRNVFDFSAVTKSLTENAGVTRDNFLLVALYISFVNSLLEEFFFRGFAFITLKEKTSRGFAYGFSAAMFAAYHVSMMIGWFGMEVIALTVSGLLAGGLIFNFFNEKSKTVYTSWLVHMFANFSINTIGLMLFEA